VSPLLKSQKLKLAEQALQLPRFVGDLVVAAFFEADKDKKRQQRRDELYEQLDAWFENQMKMELRMALGKATDQLRTGDHPVTPFHWEIEFPEVFGRENPGFDAFVGNPPFMGGTKISAHLGQSYACWLLSGYEQSHGNADLVAYFFRRAYDL